jgi:transglutaminase-like putative cysteine protease
MKRILPLFFFLTFVIFFFLPTEASAVTNFSTDYHVTYTVDESGMTHALIKGVLTNTTSQYYASSYKMQLGFDTIKNIQVQDQGGRLSPQIIKNTDGYEINIQFNKKAVGLGAQQQFFIMFDTPTLARHTGTTWEINIPGIENPADFSLFVVELKTPASFGQPAYIKPKQETNTLLFDKDMLGKSGISVAFGDKQNYTFQLTYHLKNPNLFPITKEVALPPSTNYQDVAIAGLEPKPQNVIEDTDGNWIAQYRLHSAQKITVKAEGTAVVHLNPKKQEETSDNLQKYLAPAPYWEVSDEKIRELADGLKTPREIYQYVVNTLHYDFSRVTGNAPRLGGLAALQNPKSAVCREFTDLFITLARAAKIPARELDGYAFTENPKQRPLSQEKDILHVWPEYYDSEKKMWVMVDPTWGSTTGGVDYFDTLDFDHFAFVIKGRDSAAPIPAGGYKFAKDPVSKDVKVAFTKDTPSLTPLFETINDMPKTTIAGLPIEGHILIKNVGSAYIQPQTVTIASQTFAPNKQHLAIQGIPPFGTLSIPIIFISTTPLTNTEGDYSIQIAGKTTSTHLQSQFFLLTPLCGGITVGIVFFIIFIIVVKYKR